MPHPIQQTIAALRRRVRVLVLTYAAAWIAGLVVATVALLCLADYLLRFQDRGIRTIALLSVVGLAGWALWRYLWTALRTPLSDVALARRIERRYPHLKDRLASAIQFLQQSEDDPEAGSAAMRREVVVETTAELEHLNPQDAIEPRPVRRALGIAAAVCLAAGLLVVLDPSSARTALVRLANPMGDTAWPKVHHLAFKDPPRRLAVGSRFDVELTDVHGRPLPDTVRIHYRFDTGGDGEVRIEPMTAARGLMTFGMDDVRRDFSYRAEGGDDDSMPWIDLKVIEPPAVEKLVVTLHYPAYTGWPATESAPHLRAIVGTRVALAGETTKPLRSATLKVDNGPEFAMQVSEDGYKFSLASEGDNAYIIKKSGAYSFDFEDREGFRGGAAARYDVRAVEDRAPTVAIEEPSSDVFVTADAVVPLKILAKDDLALARVALHYARSDKSDEPETVLPLYDGPQPFPQAAAPPTDAAQGESRLIEHAWRLDELKLKPGTRVTVFASATDYQPLATQSHPRRLTIITTDELEDRLAERQGAILNELTRLLKLERDARARVAGLEIQAEQVGKLTKADIDHLQQAELTQRQVDRGLTSDAEGVPSHIKGLLNDLKNNKVDNSEIQRRMTALEKELGRLGEEHLPTIARELTSSLKEFQARLPEPGESKSTPGKSPGERDKPPSPKPEAPATKPTAADNPASEGPQPAAGESPRKEPTTPGGKSLAEAGRRQDEVVKSLEQMLDELAEWDTYRRFHRDISQLRRDQEELAKDTAAVGAKTLTKDVKDLDAQQQADLKKLAQRQLELGRHLEKVQQGMEQMGDKLKESDPLVAENVADALHHAKQKALSGQMREAGRNVEQNQVGQAAQHQQQTMKELDELLDILSNRRERELGRLVKKLREAEQQLDQLRKKQDGLQKKLKQAAENPNEEERKRELERLSREQKQLQEEADRFARSLQRLQAEKAARSAAKGGAKMGQAGQQGQQGDAAGAAEQAEAAKKDLDDAQQQLAQQRKKAEQDLAQEQMAKMEETLKGFQQQQEKLLAETRHYDDVRQKQGRFSRAESISVRDLSRQQQALQEDVEAKAEELAAAAVFELQLKHAARRMAGAAELLEQRETGEAAQRAEQDALARLKQLMDALKSASKKPKQGGQQAGGGEGGGQGGGGDGVRSISELKLMKLMQEQVNERTKAIEEKLARTKTLTAEEQQEYEALGREQGELADLLLEMTKPAKEEDPEDDLKKELLK